MSRTVTSGSITFIDTTDSRKLDIYIANNMPTVQIYNPNNQNPYSPDWTTNTLTLTASVYLDSADVTENKDTSIIWDKQIGTNVTSDIARGKTLTIKDNISSTNNIVTYICRASHKGVNAQHKIDFTRVDAGANGTNGSPAPAVQAQYSVDGETGWMSTLNAATHKYIRYSYDGGTNWTTKIKMVGDDGTSVTIKGTATSRAPVSGTSYYTLVYNSATITGATLGDAYILETDGHLYVCVDSRDGNDRFMDVGEIKGPKGNDGVSEYVYIRYASNANPSNSDITITPSSTTTHIGICVSTSTSAPTTASSYTWSKFVGDSAKSIVLSGDSQVFKVGKSSTNTTPEKIIITATTINISDTNSIIWSYRTNNSTSWLSLADGATDVQGGIDRTGNTVTVTGKDLTSTITSITFKASYGDVEDVFTIYKAFDGIDGSKGADGQSASMAFLTNENVTLSANSSGVVSGATQFSTNVVVYNGTNKESLTIDNIGTITGIPSGVTVSKTNTNNNEVAIIFTVDALGSTLGSTSSNNGEIKIPVNGSSINTNLVLNWSKVNSGAKGDKGDKGVDAYTVILTNESHVFAGDVSNAIAGEAETQVLAYIGTTQQKAKILKVNNQTAAIVDTAVEGITGLTFKCDTISEVESPKITFKCTTAFNKRSGTIPVTLSVGGVEITKMFAYSIALKGATGGTGSQGPQGPAATSYWLVSSASAVQRTSTGTITVTPSTLTFAGKSKTGTNAPVDYACRWIIAYSTDGTNYTNLYTSTANETSKSITVATTYKTIRARMYMAGGTTSLLDEQIIPVVTDGTPSITFQVYAPNGYVLSNKTPSLMLQTYSYEGSTEITSGATYQWSQLIDDVWTDISEATNTTYTVTQADVLKAKSYRCVMTYKEKDYFYTVTVQDKTDMYNSIMCVSSNSTNNDCYWVLYTLVYTDAGEVDPLLGPISIDAPLTPVSGDYWYAVDTDGATVTLKKYNGTSWDNSTDTQSLSYYWDIINDGSAQIPLGDSAKVKVVSCHDFTATATIMCEVSNLEDGLLTQSSLSLTDASDPIVSDTEPTATVNGQIWIKPNDNGTYLMFIWDESTSSWISSDMDTRSKVYTSKPSSYNVGDLWITATDTDHGSYLQGTLLQAQASRTTYSAADWSPTLRYDREFDELKEDLDELFQYVSINGEGLRIRAKNSSGVLSPFSSLFTSTELAFYQNSKKLLTLANNQLTAPKIVVEDDLEVQGTIGLGDLQIIIESNGSFSFAVQK